MKLSNVLLILIFSYISANFGLFLMWQGFSLSFGVVGFLCLLNGFLLFIGSLIVFGVAMSSALEGH